MTMEATAEILAAMKELTAALASRGATPGGDYQRMQMFALSKEQRTPSPLLVSKENGGLEVATSNPRTAVSLLNLDSTRTIEVLLTAAHTTNPLEIYASYQDFAKTELADQVTDNTTNGTTAVTVIAAPATGVTRGVNFLSVYNADTAAKSVIVRVFNGTNRRTICKREIQPGETLVVTPTEISVQIPTVVQSIIAGDGLSSSGTAEVTLSVNVDDTTLEINSDALRIKNAGVKEQNIDNGAVTYAKIQNVSATDKLLGRSTAGAGVVEEITCTAAARSILDDASTSAIRTTLGVGTGDTPTFAGINLGDENLNDYDEGTFTPTIFGTTGSLGAYAANASEIHGTYVRIGSQVWIKLYIVLTNKGSWTGNARVGGLPFTSAAQGTGTFSTVAIGWHSGITIGASTIALGGYILPNDTSVFLAENVSASSPTALPMTSIANNSGIMISGWYKV